MSGYVGTLLRVNLSEQRISKEPLAKELLNLYVGGRGLNSRLLYDELAPDIDPLGPQNKIIVGTGPCNGTIVPGSQRFTITSKSPISGFLGDSNSGASFGAEIKYAGYDIIVVEGVSEHPVSLWICDDRVELKPAGHLWGKTTRETERELTRDFGDPDACVISIGPAGENQVRFANLVNDLGRAQGRTGQGAVFGSKRLKAMIVRGSGGVRAARPRQLHEAVRETHKAWDKNMPFKASRVKYGPPGGWVRYENFGMLPTHNYQSGKFQRSMLANIEHYFVKQKACFSCPVGCDHLFVVPEGAFRGAYGCGGELSNLGDLGAKIGCDRLDLMFKASELCDGLGVDYFDMSGIIAYAMEIFQKGILTETDTGGLKLEWGDADAILALIEMTAKRQGIGDVFANGMKKTAEIIGRGTGKYMMHAKGQAFAMRDPRASKGWGLGYAVSSRGPCHVRAHLPETLPPGDWDTAVQHILQKYKDPTNPLLEEGKGELVGWHENLQAFKNSLEICHFAIYPWMFSVPQMLARFYNAVTGNSIDAEKLLHIGERIISTERAFNVREGLTREDDTLPRRMLEEPMPDGPAKGQVVNLEMMLNDYYRFRGWDQTTGFPTRHKLVELGLEDIAAELEKMERVSF
jgi:aldehyde:ferredoxin oxidoreductase